MVSLRLRFPAAFALALIASADQGLAAQPGTAPEGEIRTPAQRFAAHPYKSALGALANYRSCGVHVRAGAFAALSAELSSFEARAIARGLGPMLDRLRQEYRELLAVSSMVACSRGPRIALASARGAIQAFGTWVANQPD